MDKLAEMFKNVNTEDIIPRRPVAVNPAWAEKPPEDDGAEDKEEPLDDSSVSSLGKALAKDRIATRRLEKRVDALMSGFRQLQVRFQESQGIWVLGSRRPSIHPTAYIAPGATVIGTVVMHKNSSIWFNTTVRGDNEIITIGEDTNIQDNSVLHCDPGIPLTVGRNVLVGHQVCLHGCTIGENCLIGMRTTMLDGSQVGNNCFVASNTFIGQNVKFGDNALIGGTPAKKVIDLDAEKLAIVSTAGAGYVENKEKFRALLAPYGLEF
mmetsp:Transcript_37950/g.80690  ORF Transcript_37950/g.80690 Transcript_37950/m.80690 type:complete len:266 (+) Transcript_37950:88-885(+)